MIYFVLSVVSKIKDLKFERPYRFSPCQCFARLLAADGEMMVDVIRPLQVSIQTGNI